MPLPLVDTHVTFADHGLDHRATVLFVDRLAGADPEALVVITDITPFHPVDHRWPDQGPDIGHGTIEGLKLPVVDCLVGATDGTRLLLGPSVDVRPGEPGWAFVVAHVLLAPPVQPKPGDTIEWHVDHAHRLALSAGHTSCHLAAVALNEALADRWRKAVPADGLGSPDFDQLAITSSRIVRFGSVDEYRLGKSLRKKGFDAQGLALLLPVVERTINTTLARWVAAGAEITVVSAGPGLTDRRTFVCRLTDGTQEIPCGGTHLESLAGVGAITVELILDEAVGVLTMTTALLAKADV